MNRDIEQTLAGREFGDRILRALRRLLDEDEYLLRIDANERSLTHCLAVHLRAEFADWHVDCEYNRDGVDPKRLPYLDLYPDSEDENAKTVYPDIIVHRRGSAKNLVVIEIKKTSNNRGHETDMLKLRGYRRSLGYRTALFIEFEVGAATGISRVQWVDDADGND